MRDKTDRPEKCEESQPQAMCNERPLARYYLECMLDGYRTKATNLQKLLDAMPMVLPIAADEALWMLIHDAGYAR